MMNNYDDRIDPLLDSLQELKLALRGESVTSPDSDQPPEPYDFKDAYELIDSIVYDLSSIRKSITLKHVYSLGDQLEQKQGVTRRKSQTETELQQDLF